MSGKKRTVIVVKGAPGGPATINTYPHAHPSLRRVMYLGREIESLFGKDKTALFEAEMIDDIWRLGRCLTHEGARHV